MKNRSWAGVALVVGAILAAGCGDPQLAALEKSDQLYGEAAKAQAGGDQAKALELFGQAIAAKPTPHAYLARAKLYLEMKNEAGAKSDAEAGLQLDAENRDLAWLRDQLNKPAKQRFKGAEAKQPTDSK